MCILLIVSHFKSIFVIWGFLLLNLLIGCLEKDFLIDVSRIQLLSPGPSKMTSKPLILTTTSLPLKFGVENQKDHLPKRKK